MKRLLLLPLLLAVFACSRAADGILQGYGEADYVYLASQESGVLRQLSVREGDHVDAGAQVFALDPDRLSYSAQSASAQGAVSYTHLTLPTICSV